MAQPVLIAADWGSTNFRLYLMDQAGKILASKSAPIGLKAITDGGFDVALEAQLDDAFSDPNLPILICGMAGSKNGWYEAPYVPTPATANDAASALCTIPDTHLGVLAHRKIHIVPGLNCRSDANIFDVMRGEETQLFGLLAAQPNLHGHVVMPGTHCKWTYAKAGQVDSFSTYMTGEIHSLLMTHSLLKADDQTTDLSVFDLGLKRSYADPSLLSLLFSARTERLFDHIGPQSVSSYVSGLLIGHEIAAEARKGDITEVHLIGAAQLSALYARAFSTLGSSLVTLHDSDTVTARGLFEIFKQTQNLAKV